MAGRAEGSGWSGAPTRLDLAEDPYLLLTKHFRREQCGGADRRQLLATPEKLPGERQLGWSAYWRRLSGEEGDRAVR
jgi:hypothetical protein